MTTGARLAAIELDAFRGFAAPRRLELDAGVVLLRGENGTGKTSLTDGLLWLFTGTIPRLAERAKGLRKSEDPIVSRYRPAGPARVRLTIDLSDGKTLEFERKGTASDSELSAFEEDRSLPDPQAALVGAFGNFTQDQFTQAVGSWGILQQHALLAALDSGATMHQRLAEVVGLERVMRFVQSADEVSKKIGRESKHAQDVLASLVGQRDQAASRLASARTAAVEPADVPRRLQALVQEAAAKLPEGFVLGRKISSLEELAALGREVGALAERAQNLADAASELEKARSSLVGEVSELERELAALVREVESAVKRAPIQVQLATSALELIDDTCPVCGQAIEEGSVREHLQELLVQAKAEAATARAGEQAVAEAQSRLQSARVAQERFATARQRCDTELEQLRSQISKVPSIEVDPSLLTVESGATLSTVLGSLEDRLRTAHSEGQRTAGAEIVRLSSEVEVSEAEIERATTQQSQIVDRAARAKELAKAAHIAAERVVERALARLGPSFAEVFDRLSPHPTFTELRATQDIYYGKNQVVPEVHDPERNVSGNPSLLFSEGQLNVVALSYFLGLALNAGENSLPFVILDDPLQTMDVLSVLGFSDLCRRLRERRQLIITTHDRRFASLLGRKLTPREKGDRTILHEFDAWTEEGPEVRTSEEPLADVVPLLKGPQ